MNASRRVVFAGTPEFAAVHLDALVAAGHDVCAVLTQPDRPAGRGKQVQTSAVKRLAQANEIPVLQPASLRTPECHAVLEALNAEIMVVVAYGLILPQSILNIPKHGCLNVHASLLPRWRGAAPIQRAIEAGDAHTGVTIMQMDAGLDTGGVVSLQGPQATARGPDRSVGHEACRWFLRLLCRECLWQPWRLYQVRRPFA